MRDYNVYYTACCGFMFVGMNHSPEHQGICRNCGGVFKLKENGK